VCVAGDDTPAFWRGSVGRPLPGVTVVVVDEDDHPCPAGRAGEVVVCSPWAMLGRLPTGEHDPERPPSQHGLRTGDVGRLDDDGCLTLDGRLDDIANVAGVRVAMLAVAARVQQALEAAFCHVVAVADDVTGARLIALVPTSAVGTGRLPSDVVQLVTAAERPALLVGVDVLPMLPSGKLDRAQARGIAEAAWSSRGGTRV
jgi:acyl-coenzyme A synthetase/AMP-(fatty) acid ligase